MKTLPLCVLMFALALSASAATWTNVSLMDATCAGRPDLMAKPDRHSRTCALQCSRSGYGVIIGGVFVPFDKKGSALAKVALSKSTRKNQLRVNVTGEMKRGVIHVTALSMP